ncbi:hypothetical protein TNCV_2476851 [Trichonephila clavipes]|nr:hypothetical protein TNCV_2476851 [Trichonephila clavipes]
MESSLSFYTLVLVSWLIWFPWETIFLLQHASATCSPPVGATRRPSYRIVEGLQCMTSLERIDVFTFSYPYETVTVQRLQWMTSSKDWKELISSRSPDGTILLIRCEIFFVCCVFERGEE